MYIYSSIHLSLVPSQSLTSKQIDGSHLWHHLGLDRYCKYIFPQDSECGKLDRFFRWFDGLTSCDTALNLLNLGPVGPTKRAGRQLWHPSKCESQVPKSCRICDLIFVCLDSEILRAKLQRQDLYVCPCHLNHAVHSAGLNTILCNIDHAIELWLTCVASAMFVQWYVCPLLNVFIQSSTCALLGLFCPVLLWVCA